MALSIKVVFLARVAKLEEEEEVEEGGRVGSHSQSKAKHNTAHTRPAATGAKRRGRRLCWRSIGPPPPSSLLFSYSPPSSSLLFSLHGKRRRRRRALLQKNKEEEEAKTFTKTTTTTLFKVARANLFLLLLLPPLSPPPLPRSTSQHTSPSPSLSPSRVCYIERDIEPKGMKEIVTV